jgi:hypothetical protein
VAFAPVSINTIFRAIHVVILKQENAASCQKMETTPCTGCNIL